MFLNFENEFYNFNISLNSSSFEKKSDINNSYKILYTFFKILLKYKTKTINSNSDIFFVF